jgi:DNA topoisomerase-1
MVLVPNSSPEKLAEDANLRYTTDERPGFMRMKNGKRFSYYDEDGKRITDKKVIERIEKLGIPPAWRDVWICSLSYGHLQATGLDEKKRKQYIYHTRWNEICNQNKFDRMIFFGEVLPTIRNEISRRMGETGLSKKKILATIVWLLENTFVRVGNPEYAKENQSFGLTTLRHKHVESSPSKVTLEFKGKSGVLHEVEIENPRVVKIIRKLEDLPGYELFQYVGGDGERRVVESSDVNQYLKELAGEEITAKYFRTWGGSILSAKTLETLGRGENKTQTKKNITQAVKEVSKLLRNTCSVCRQYYIHPTILETYQKGALIPHLHEAKKRSKKKPERLTLHEFGVLTLLKKYT